MPRITLPSEQAGTPLSLAQAEANYALFRALFLVTISAGGDISIEGTGRYQVAANSGVADDLTTITLTGESIQGTLIELRPDTGDTITVKHQGTLHLSQGLDQVLSTTRTSLWLRHDGGNVWTQAFPLMYVP